MTKDAKIFLALALTPVIAIIALVLIEPFTPAPSFEPFTLGAILGWSALLALAVAMAYSYRKRITRQGVGSLYTWRVIHCATGYLFLILLFIHANGQLGMESQFILSVISIGIALSGVWGMAVQELYPKWITSTLVDSVYKDELKDDVNELLHKISKSIEGRSDDFNSAYQKHILPYVTINQPTITTYKDMKDRLLGKSSDHSHAAVNDLDKLMKAERNEFLLVAHNALDLMEIRLNQSYQRRMNGWLIWHIGLSVLLLVVLFSHIMASFYY